MKIKFTCILIILDNNLFNNRLWDRGCGRNIYHKGSCCTFNTWFEGRHEASGKGYSQPDFEKIADAYNISYRKISNPEDIIKEDLDSKEGIIFDVILHPNTLIEPKIDSGNPLHNMSPYLDLDSDSLEKKYLK